MTDKDIVRQIQDIRSLMYKSNKDKMISSAALIAWGIIATIAFEITPIFFFNGYFKNKFISVIATIIIHFILFSLGLYLEHSLTEKKAAERDDVLDYTWHQVIKLFALLLAFGTFLTIILAIHGIGRFIYPVWIIIVGIGTYFCGLFSLKYFERYGMMLMIVGVLSSFITDPFKIRIIADVLIGAGLIVSGIYINKRYGW